MNREETIQLLQQLIVDGQSQAAGETVPRETELLASKGKVTVCMGVRRCGKSTLMQQEMAKLLHAGAEPEDMVYIHFDDDRLLPLREYGVGLVSEAYRLLYPGRDAKRATYYFFDEIQVLPGWPLYVERLRREPGSRVYITGSSAKMLSREIATELRGRTLSWELFPFSFREFVQARGENPDAPVGTDQALRLQALWQEYGQTGGFPEVVLEPHPELRRRILQEYFNALLFRDIVERHEADGCPESLVRLLSHRLLGQLGGQVVSTKLQQDLTGYGIKTTRATIGDLCRWYEDAYLMFFVTKWDASAQSRLVAPRKVYAVDTALAGAVSAGILQNRGAVLENQVFMHLRRQFRDFADEMPIHYYKTAKNHEVDFAVARPGSQPLLVQVSESLADTRTRTRELRALTEAMVELHADTGYIITQNETETITTPTGTIRVLPAWRMALDGLI